MPTYVFVHEKQQLKSVMVAWVKVFTYWFFPEQRFLWARTSIDLLPEPLLRRKCAFTDDGRDEIGKKIYYMRESKLEMKRKKNVLIFCYYKLVS